MLFPFTTAMAVDWGMTLGVPILAGYLLSKLLERYAWFQEVIPRNVVVIAACIFLALLLTLLKWQLLGGPAGGEVDTVIHPLLSILAMYLATQVTHGSTKAAVKAGRAK